MQNALLSIISTVGSKATFAGIATPDTNPGTPDQNVFYIASENGQYVNFNSVVVYNKVAIFTNKNGNWVKKETGIPTNEIFTEICWISQEMSPAEALELAKTARKYGFIG
jgi:hypothetical protein